MMKIKDLLEMDMSDVIDWLIENQDKYELVKPEKKCPACNGMGFFLAPDDFADKCKTCKGTGIVK